MEIRAMLPPALPRIRSQESAPEEASGNPARPIQRRAPDAFARRPPVFVPETSPSVRPAPSMSVRHRQAIVAPEPSPSAPSVQKSKPPVAERVAEAATPRPCPTRIRIRVSPEEFGELVLDLRLRGSVLHGCVIAESESARERIQSQLDLLKDTLHRRGVRVGALEVTVGGPDDEAPARVRSVRPQLLDLLA